MNNDVILEIKGLRKVFSKDVEQPIEVLKNINLIVKKGINLKKGQDVVVRADLDQPEFVKLVVISVMGNIIIRTERISGRYVP